MDTIQEDKQTALEMLENIKNYLEDEYAPDEYLKKCEFIKNFILDLICDYEATVSLAEVEGEPREKPIIEKIRE